MTLVAVSTLGMAVSHGMPAWLALRFVAGVASALVMMGIAGWALVQLATLGRNPLGGCIFGCVGLSITVVGGVVFVIGTTVGDPRAAWAVLGLASAALAVGTWRPLSREPARSSVVAAGRAAARRERGC